MGDAPELLGDGPAYLLTSTEQLAAFLPSQLTREPNKPFLISWDFLKLLPPAWYAIVFGLTAAPAGRFSPVPEGMLSLDGYPVASRSQTDVTYVAGFTSQKALRLLLSPHALRFFHFGLHEPLRRVGAWPSAREVMMRGFVLADHVQRRRA